MLASDTKYFEKNKLIMDYMVCMSHLHIHE